MDTKQKYKKYKYRVIQKRTLEGGKRDASELGACISGLNDYDPSECNPVLIASRYMEKQKVVPSVIGEHPWFIYSWGPPASGKSTCIQRFAEHFKLPSSSLCKLMVDEIVEMMPEYREKCTKQKKDCSGLYSKYRPIADKISDYVLFLATAQNLSVVMESTGRDTRWIFENVFPWLKKVMHPQPLAEVAPYDVGEKLSTLRIPEKTYFEEKLSIKEPLFPESRQKLNYQIALVYPYVKLPTLLVRNRKRALEIGRYPDENFVAATYELAQHNLLAMIQDEKSLVDTIVVYDNTVEMEDRSKACMDILLLGNRVRSINEKGLSWPFEWAWAGDLERATSVMEKTDPLLIFMEEKLGGVPEEKSA